MNSAMIHLLTHTPNAGYMDKWPRGVAALCAACSWFQHNVGWPGKAFGSVNTGIFSWHDRPARVPPPDFNNWPPDQRKQWIKDMVNERRSYDDPPSLSTWASWAVKETTGTSETTKANGCTKG